MSKLKSYEGQTLVEYETKLDALLFRSIVEMDTSGFVSESLEGDINRVTEIVNKLREGNGEI
jgi:hypothetical protein